MLNQIKGLHHVTSLASSARENNAFFTKVLGLRRVKKTVNFDAPDVYHLYYADEVGTPGTVMTYFPFPNAARGRPGVGEVGTTVFTVPKGSLDAWADRFATFDVEGVKREAASGRTASLSAVRTATASRWSRARRTAPRGRATASARTSRSAASTRPPCACATMGPRRSS